MKLRWICVAYAACGGAGEAPLPAPQPLAPAHVAPAKPPRPVHAQHLAPIAQLAITEDGKAAASADTLGAVRLWPSLDGTREPVVIAAAAPQELAIARADSGYVIAIRDTAHTVELIRTDRDGMTIGRTALPGEAQQVEVGAFGALVLSADGTIERRDPTGVRTGRLVPEGERVARLVVHDQRALAIVEAPAGVVTRWIELAGDLRWGASSRPLAVAASTIVLAPDDRRIAARRAGGKARVVLVDLASGATTDACDVDPMLPPDDIAPVGFGDDHTLACTSSGRLAWWDVASRHVVGDPSLVAFGQVVVAGGIAVTAAEHELAILRRDATKFLGYGVRDPEKLRVDAAGIAIDGERANTTIRLDDGFVQRALVERPYQDRNVVERVALDERYELQAVNAPGDGDPWGSAYALTVVDTIAYAEHQKLSLQASAPRLAYEPATRLLATEALDGPVLLRFDPATGNLGAPTTLAVSGRVHLVDPELAGGVAAIVIDPRNRAHEIRAADLAAGRSYPMPHEVIAVDRTGRMYSRVAGDLVAYVGGEQVARLVGLGKPNQLVRPSPDGKLVAVLDGAVVTLATAAGDVRWRVPVWGASELAWTGRGVPFVVAKGGLAAFDVATGALADRQCGWGFGLSDTRHDLPGAEPTICDAR